MVTVVGKGRALLQESGALGDETKTFWGTSRNSKTLQQETCRAQGRRGPPDGSEVSRTQGASYLRGDALGSRLRSVTLHDRRHVPPS